MAHFGFILASYLVTFAILGALFTWIILDGRAQKRALADLETRGVKRRSSTASDPSSPRLTN